MKNSTSKRLVTNLFDSDDGSDEEDSLFGSRSNLGARSRSHATSSDQRTVSNPAFELNERRESGASGEDLSRSDCEGAKVKRKTASLFDGLSSEEDEDGLFSKVKAAVNK